MPHVKPKSYADLREIRRTADEVVYAEPKGYYVGAILVTIIVGIVLGVPAWALVRYFAEALGSVPGVVMAANILAGFGALVGWLWFGQQRRRELRIYPQAARLTFLEHHMIGRTRKDEFSASEVREIELCQTKEPGEQYFLLRLNFKDGRSQYLDGCSKDAELLPLAQTLSGVLGLPLVRRN